MNDDTQQAIRGQLFTLEARLERVNQSWSVTDYEALLHFHVRILPEVLKVERASIFFSDHTSRKVWLKFGTHLLENEIEAPFEGSIVGSVITSGQPILENGLDQRSGFHTHTDRNTGFVTKSIMCVPITSLADGTITGAIQVLNHKDGKAFDNDSLHQLQEVAKFLSMIIDNIQINKEIVEISSRISKEVSFFNARTPLITASRPMQEVVNLARMVSSTPVNVFIQGENGTGKELLSRLIHESSDRCDQPFVAVNCASIPENLMESEFFGYEKGAFTGAAGSRSGRFEEAKGGTLFLDEIADMPMHIQPKFLRAIQEREGTRLGSNKVISYDFRIITATNCNLHERIQQGRFREDLFYRLFSVELRIPPLRERPEDIVPLATNFLRETCKRFDKRIRGFDKEVIERFERFPWPGNVRQLKQEVERLVALTPDQEVAQLSTCSEEIRRVGLNGNGGVKSPFSMETRLKELEIKLIRDALAETAGNKLQAAKILGITRQGLHKKMGRLEIN